MINRKTGIGSGFSSNLRKENVESSGLRDRTKKRRGIGSSPLDAYEHIEWENRLEFGPPSDPPPPDEDPPPPDPTKRIYRDALGREISYEQWLREQERIKEAMEEARRRQERQERFDYQIRNDYNAVLEAHRLALLKRNKKMPDTLIKPDDVLDEYYDHWADFEPDAPSNLGVISDEEAMLLNLKHADRHFTIWDSLQLVDKTKNNDWQKGSDLNDRELEIRKRLNQGNRGSTLQRILDLLAQILLHPLAMGKELYESLLEYMLTLPREKLEQMLEALGDILSNLQNLGLLDLKKPASELVKLLPILSFFGNMIRKLNEANYGDDYKRSVRDAVNTLIESLIPMYFIELIWDDVDNNGRGNPFDLWSTGFAKWVLSVGDKIFPPVLKMFKDINTIIFKTYRGPIIQPMPNLFFYLLR